ncbi:MAG: xylulokinase [Christensenellales bacterium]
MKTIAWDKGKACIAQGRAVLGIELGSTRIKAVLIGEDRLPLCAGTHAWENQLEGGVWTYSLQAVEAGLQAAYRDLAGAVKREYGLPLKQLGAIGISAMMHGYLAFDREDRLLTPFRTWRNTMTEAAAEALSERFSFNIPQRWSVAHLEQALMNGEAQARQLSHLTTLAGYVHWWLTGQKVLGVGDASGMFPIDSETCDWDKGMLEQFDGMHEDLPWRLRELLPRVLRAGEAAGCLTDSGAGWLDPSGELAPGAPLCPPEGDAGTGMVATASVAPRTGNVSAGTSIFAMIVLEGALKRPHREIDMVCTPEGAPVAMVHCNNCSSDLDAWMGLFAELGGCLGLQLPRDELYERLYTLALSGEADAGGLLSYNYYSGEPITGLEAGRPLFVRRPDSRFTLSNFMRAHLLSAFCTLRLGMDILLAGEGVQVDRLLGHGGIFRTAGVMQRLMAAAVETPVSVMQTAGEGGAWGIALLADYLIHREVKDSLSGYLAREVFRDMAVSTLQPDPQDVAGFRRYLRDYQAGLAIQRAAVDTLR